MRQSVRMIFATLTALFAGAAHAVDVPVDNDLGSPRYTETGSGWTTSGNPGYNGGTYRFTLSANAVATWNPIVPFSTSYNVYAVFRTGGNRPSKVLYTINHVSGATVVGVNQQGTGDMAEAHLGNFSFAAGTAGNIRLTSAAGGVATIADAIILRMGDAADNPPVITNIVRMPGNVTSTTAVNVRALIADEGLVQSAAVTYSISTPGPETTIQAFDDGAHDDGAAGDSVYGATIPAFPDGVWVTWRFRASDNLSQERLSETRTYHISRYPPAEYRALWADSWTSSFLNQAEADNLISTMRTANLNTLIPEVRKVGDAYYDSAYEPRADNISGGSGYDPLAYLIQLGHDTSGGKNRIDIHAWFVMNRIAVGSSLPAGHVLMLHPEYEMLKSDGTFGSTRYLDPGHPGAVDHNVAVVVDCVTNYDIDGYNFDYIRYPEAAGMWGYNATSIARFNALHGRSGTPDDWDPLWRAWRRECVSLMVKKIYVKAWKVKPHVLLTADTVNWGWCYNSFADSTAYNYVFQDWSGWMQGGFMDYNALMSYARLTDPARHQGWTERSLTDEGSRGSIIGVGVYLSATIAGSMDQLHYARSAGADGLNIYDWGSEVNSSTSGETRVQFYDALKTQVFPTYVPPPVSPWRTSPTTGMFEGNVTFQGQPVDHATVRIVGYPQTETVTDGSGWYAILDVPPGTHPVEFVKTGVGVGTRTIPGTIPTAGNVITLDAQLDIPAQIGEWSAY